MNEKTRKKIVFMALPIAAIWGAFNLFGPDKSVEVKAPETIKPLTAVDAAHETALDIDIDKYSAAPWGRDPFRTRKPAVRNSAPRSLSWVVTGIIYSNTSPVAYVNRERVQVGDIVNKAKVVKIDRKSVTLEHEGKQIKLSVSKG